MSLLDESVKRGRGRNRPAFRTHDRADFARARVNSRITQHLFEFACDTRAAVALLPDRSCHPKSRRAGSVVGLVVCVRHHEHRPPRT